MNGLVLSANAISPAARAAMLARAFVAITCVIITHCLTIHQHRKDPEIETVSLEELPPLFIVCNLTDIVTITVPATHNNDSLYFLFNPDNDVRKLDITSPTILTHDNAAINEVTDATTRNNKVIQATYNVMNVNFGQKIDSKTNDSIGEKENEFVIGPVGEQDHGNWVLSTYYKKNGSWVEQFRVITIQIIEHVPTRQTSPMSGGSSLELGFAYPLPDLETCELIQPDTVNRPFDRYFREYEWTALPTCTYVLRDLTTQDAGVWTIIGVGHIVYEGHSNVEVNSSGKSVSVSERLVSSSGGIRYLAFNFILPIGLILKIYCLQ